jgi:hypothetical protein
LTCSIATRTSSVATDRGIRVIEVHGSIDDKPNMAIMLRQIAGRVLSDARRSAIGAIFGYGPHHRVFVLGYSCSDLFDLSPLIEALANGHREVIFIDHHRDRAELRSLSERMEKNPFRQFPEARWALCDTDAAERAARAGAMTGLRPGCRRLRRAPPLEEQGGCMGHGQIRTITRTHKGLLPRSACQICRLELQTGPLRGRQQARAFYDALFADLSGEKVTSLRRYYGPDFVVDESPWEGTEPRTSFGIPAVAGA